MVIEKTAEQALSQLIHQLETRVSVGEFLIDVVIDEKRSKLSFSTPVYTGENDIPITVRGCLFEKFPDQVILTNLSVDEPTHTVNLHYSEELKGLDFDSFKDLLEEFAHIADLWCCWLEDHDHREFVYVRK